MWALQYWVAMQRRLFLEDKRSELEMQCYHLFPERWTQIYSSQGGDYGQAFGGEEEIPVIDPEDLDAWFQSLAAQQGLTGAEAEAMFSEASTPFMGFAEGEGRRV